MPHTISSNPGFYRRIRTVFFIALLATVLNIAQATTASAPRATAVLLTASWTPASDAMTATTATPTRV